VRLLVIVASVLAVSAIAWSAPAPVFSTVVGPQDIVCLSSSASQEMSTADTGEVIMTDVPSGEPRQIRVLTPDGDGFRTVTELSTRAGVIFRLGTHSWTGQPVWKMEFVLP
jgi:hypothetical protein